jgi:hypothetical protein
LPPSQAPIENPVQIVTEKESLVDAIASVSDQVATNQWREPHPATLHQ